jgi:hypothetical protein
MYDIFFISYDEPNADYNWKLLKNRFNFSKRIDKVDGIFNAHTMASRKSLTTMFYVVDGDAEVLEKFNFDYIVSKYDENITHIWRSINPINELVYGYGAIKLFPKSVFQNERQLLSPDITTGVSSNIKIINEISNITRFNTDPFNTWKSAFRECVKLSSKIISGQKDNETLKRLEIWCSVGEDAPYGKYSIIGAKMGKEFGTIYKDDLTMLRKINDWDWLKTEFEKLIF